MAGGGLLQRPGQYVELALPTHKRRQTPAAQRLEATARPALAYGTPCSHRLGEALQLVGAEIGQVEQLADQPSSRGRDDHCAGLSQRLQTCRQVWHVANDHLFARRPFANQVAHHRKPCGDPDPRLQPNVRVGLKLSKHLNQREPGPHGPLGIVLVRFRPAEVGENAVAQILGDVPVEAPTTPAAWRW